MAEEQDFVERAAAAELDTEDQKARYGGDDGYADHTANLLKLTEQGLDQGLTEEQLKDPKLVAELAAQGDLAAEQGEDTRQFDDFEAAFDNLQAAPQAPAIDDLDIDAAFGNLQAKPAEAEVELTGVSGLEAAMAAAEQQAAMEFSAAEEKGGSSLAAHMELIDDGPAPTTAASFDAEFTAMENAYPGMDDPGKQAETAAQMKADGVDIGFGAAMAEFKADEVAVAGLQGMPSLEGIEADVSPEFKQAAQTALEQAGPEQTRSERPSMGR